MREAVTLLAGLYLILLGLVLLWAWLRYHALPRVRLLVALSMMNREWYTRRPVLFTFVDWVLLPGGLGFRLWLRYCWPRGWRAVPWAVIGVAFVLGWVCPWPLAALSVVLLISAAYLLWA